MVEPTMLQVVVGIGTTIAGGIYAEVRRARKLGERNNKLLEGFEDSEAYDGVVQQVERHEQALRDNGLLNNTNQRGGN